MVNLQHTLVALHRGEDGGGLKVATRVLAVDEGHAQPAGSSKTARRASVGVCVYTSVIADR